MMKISAVRKGEIAVGQTRAAGTDVRRKKSGLRNSELVEGQDLAIAELRKREGGKRWDRPLQWVTLAFRLEGLEAETILRRIFWRRSGHRPVPTLRDAHARWEGATGLPSAAPACHSPMAGPRFPEAGASVHPVSGGQEATVSMANFLLEHSARSAAPACSEKAEAQCGGISDKALLVGHL